MMSSGASCVPETRSPRKPGWKLTWTVELCCGSRAMPLMSSEKGEAAWLGIGVGVGVGVGVGFGFGFGFGFGLGLGLGWG